MASARRAFRQIDHLARELLHLGRSPCLDILEHGRLAIRRHGVQDVVEAARVFFRERNPLSLRDGDHLAHRHAHDLARVLRLLKDPVRSPQHGGRLIDAHIDHELPPDGAQDVVRDLVADARALQKLPHGLTASRMAARGVPKRDVPKVEYVTSRSTRTASIAMLMA